VLNYFTAYQIKQTTVECREIAKGALIPSSHSCELQNKRRYSKETILGSSALEQSESVVLK
jgi:hypothetical protein